MPRPVSRLALKGAELILIYATNGPDEKVAKDMNLYFLGL
jgi:hypothetical protein